MTVGERIKALRKERKIAASTVAEALGVSLSTIYRYEDSSITKIPVMTMERLAQVLGVTVPALLGNEVEQEKPMELPANFEDPQKAMEFILKLPTLAAFGGYDPEHMDDDTMVEFANELLQQLKLVSYKYQG